eukprot:ctg_1642.g408
MRALVVVSVSKRSDRGSGTADVSADHAGRRDAEQCDRERDAAGAHAVRRQVARASAPSAVHAAAAHRGVLRAEHR